MNMKFIKRKTIFLLLFCFIIGCGEESSKNSKVIFMDNNASPLIKSDNVYYIKEHKREAFQVEATDRSRLEYSLSEGDFFDMYIDQHTGNVFFKEFTNYKRKSQYRFKIIIKDIVGHISTLNVIIYIQKNNDKEEGIKEESFNTPLNEVDEQDFFITSWKTDNLGTSNNNQIVIPTGGDGYDYSVDWGDGTSSKHITLDGKHTYKKSGVYDIKIFGSFPLLAFRKTSDFNVSTVENDSRKLLKIKQWGSIEWDSMGGAFLECVNMNIEASDRPNLSKVTDISDMFHHAQTFNGDIRSWDTSSVTDMDFMFLGAKNFNQDIDNWNVSNVHTMRGLFTYTPFNKPLNNWDVSKVKTMQWMFNYTESFNQNLSRWNVSDVENMESMFAYASSFNQNLDDWDVSAVNDMDEIFLETTSLKRKPSWFRMK